MGKLVTIKEAAAILDLTPQRIGQLIREKGIKKKTRMIKGYVETYESRIVIDIDALKKARGEDVDHK